MAKSISSSSQILINEGLQPNINHVNKEAKVDILDEEQGLKSGLTNSNQRQEKVEEVAKKVANLIDIIANDFGSKEEALKVDNIFAANQAKVKRENSQLSKDELKVKATDEVYDLFIQEEFVDGAISAYDKKGLDFADVEIRSEFDGLRKYDIHQKD